MANQPLKLHISFHGKIIEQLGIQMYQKPVAAIAELISNGWDADAKEVRVTLPDSAINSSSVIVVHDTGDGMTFEECEKKFLNIGRGRRGNDPNERTPGGRSVLGRKGIGKFAGFGIASVIEVNTIAKSTGERTKFSLNIESLVTNEYVSRGGDIDVIEYEGPDNRRKAQHGTTITLRSLNISKRPNIDQYLTGMARRFLLAERAEDFEVKINGQPLPDLSPDETGIEFVFPSIYEQEEFAELLSPPENTEIENGWGVSELPNGEEIKWRFYFFKKPIQEEDLRGVSIYSKGKLAQSAFFFNLTGGLSGQHGQQYMSGQVEADFVDSLEDDLISPERQRINWNLAPTQELEEWGQEIVKKALSDWKKLRQKEKTDELQTRVANFSGRLDNLPTHERNTILTAINKVASVESIDMEEFVSIGDAMLTAWEKGRLRELINSLAQVGEVPEEEIPAILLEARVLSALSTSEAVKTKLEAIEGLKRRVEDRVPENAVRDYIASDAWIISPELEFYDKERRATGLLQEAVSEAHLSELDGYRGRVDLVLSHEGTLIIIEFMRPGVSLDWDHVDRFKRYVNIVKDKIEANSVLGFKEVRGYVVADRIERSADVVREIRELAKDRKLYAMNWQTLIRTAADKWKHYLDSIISRTPEDDRLRSLLELPENTEEEG